MHIDIDEDDEVDVCHVLSEHCLPTHHWPFEVLLVRAPTVSPTSGTNKEGKPEKSYHSEFEAQA